MSETHPRTQDTGAECAIETLASYLYRTMEHFDPGPDSMFVEWSDLEDGCKTIWVEAIRSLLSLDELILCALKYKHAVTPD